MEFGKVMRAAGKHMTLDPGWFGPPVIGGYATFGALVEARATNDRQLSGTNFTR